MRFRLRTLLIVLALGPPVLAGGWWGYERWQWWREQQELERAWREGGFGQRPKSRFWIDDPRGPIVIDRTPR